MHSINSKRAFFGALVLTVLSGLFCSHPALAYQPQTHRFITEQGISLYNKSHPDAPISESVISFITDGARREDDPLRWLNHFYDPISKKGLSHNGAIDPLFQFGTWESSKLWAQDEQNQSRIVYSPLIATILSSIQQKQVEKFFPTSIFTWDRAITYWVEGNIEMAMVTLGHVLHLTQDASVPDHTRNDPHVSGSPYEDFVGKSNVLKTNSSIISLAKEQYKPLSSLENAFDQIALYSNNNFYSKDTIGIQSGYEDPQPDFFQKEGTEYFGIKNGITKDYKLYKSLLGKSYFLTNNSLITLADEDVLSDYWSLLGPKSIANTAGVIELFFKEARAAQRNASISHEKSFFARIVDAAKGAIIDLFSSATNQDEEIITIPISNTSPILSVSHQATPTPSKTVAPTKSPTPSQPLVTTFPTRARVLRVIDGDTIVLENNITVRYLGIDAPELGDSTRKSGCLAQESKQRNTTLVNGKTISLEYSGEKTDSFGRLLAYVSVDNALVNQQLVREGLAYAYNFNHPHPKETVFSSAQEAARKDKIGLWGSSCAPTPTPSPSSTPKITQKTTKTSAPSCSLISSQTPSHNQLIINEVAWMGSPTSANDEWIELKNIGSLPITLSGWSLATQDGDLRIDLSESKRLVIPPDQFVLLERTNDASVPTITADIIYSGALSNSNERLMLFDPSCALIDDALAGSSWPAGDNATKRTMERAQSGFGWHTSQESGGTPGRENSYQSFGSGGGGGSSGTSPSPSSSPTPSPSASPSPSPTPTTLPNVRINEIMYNPAGADDDHEWIEIYNEGSIAFDVTSLRLIENETAHIISAIGQTTIAPLEYAIIADDVDTFLTDHPGFTAPVFDSSFSLSNEGESLSLSYDNQIVHSVPYQATWGANGDTSSLQFMNPGWYAYQPTPGKENTPSQEITSDPISASTHILISEIQVAGASPDDEFIELYNPTDSFISLRDYSIQYISGRAETLSDPYKKNFPDDDLIAPHGFYLLANGGGLFAQKADMTWNSFSLSGESKGGIIVLVATTTPITTLATYPIIDQIAYGTPILQPSAAPLPDPSMSIERNALISTKCFIAQGAYLFSGNGCDTDATSDFIVNENPFPQGSSNLAEPRSGPGSPTSFEALYDPSTFVLSLSWMPADENSYYVPEKSITTNPSDGFISLGTTTDLTSQARMIDIGLDYTIQVTAYDADGFPSAPATTTISMPGMLTHLYFYETSPGSEAYVLEPIFKTYPFVIDPNIKEDIPHWRALAFFLDQPTISVMPQYPYGSIEGISGGMQITHPTCINPDGTIVTQAVTFPDTAGMCGSGGGIFNSTYPYALLEDNRVRLPVAPDTAAQITPTSTVIVAFFTSGKSTNGDGRYPEFLRVVVDRFPVSLGEPPEPLPPTPPVITTTADNFDPIREKLVVTWDDSSDPDSLDRYIAYEFRGGASTQPITDYPWLPAVRSIDGSTYVEPSIEARQGETYVIHMRAVDEDGHYSDVSTIPISIPATEMLLTAPLLFSAPPLLDDKNVSSASSTDESIVQPTTPSETLPENPATTPAQNSTETEDNV